MNDIAIKVDSNSIGFVFEKYSKNSLHFNLRRLHGNLNEKHFTVTRNGEQLKVQFKKVYPSKWLNLFNNAKVGDNIECYRANEGRTTDGRVLRSVKKTRGKTRTLKSINRNSSIEMKKTKRTLSTNILPSANRTQKSRLNITDDYIVKSFIKRIKAYEKKSMSRYPSINKPNTVKKINSSKRFKASKAILKRNREESKYKKVPLVMEKKPLKHYYARSRVHTEIGSNSGKRLFNLTNRKRAKSRPRNKKVNKAVSAIFLPNEVNNSFNTSNTSMISSRKNNARIRVLRKEIMGIMKDLKLDTRWLKQEFTIMDCENEKDDFFTNIQHKMVYLLANKLKTERKYKFDTEMKFIRLTQKFATRQSLIDNKLSY